MAEVSDVQRARSGGGFDEAAACLPRHRGYSAPLAMGTSRRHALLLWCAATDRTFDRAELRGVEVLAGKCIHCNCLVCVDLDGTRQLRATLEHIVPRNHGGTNALDNLAVACGRCNGAKGIRHDNQRWGDPKLMEMIERLQERKRKRLRDPLEGLALPELTSFGPEDDEPDEQRSRGKKRR